MPDFDGNINRSAPIFGGISIPESVHPGVRPETPDEFRAEPGLKKSMRKSSIEEQFKIWLDSSKFIAQEARTLAEKRKSPGMLARLAHAELAAGDTETAQIAASEAFDGLLAAYKKNPQGNIDTAAAVSATWALVICGRSDIADHYLSTLPAAPAMRLVHASLVADLDQPQRALELLEGCTFPEAASMRGYVYLKMDEPYKALTQLRRAYQLGDPNPDVCANLATAFWAVGSRQKAINFARQAFELAPGRRDISLKLLDYFIYSNDLDSARNVVKDFTSRGFVETAELTERKALLAYASDRPRFALNILRRAESMASETQAKAQAAEIGGRIAFTQLALGDITKDEATHRFRTLMAVEPDNFLLLYLFSHLCDRVHMAAELRQRFEAFLSHSRRPELLLPIEVKLAELESRFDDLISLAGKWAQSDPLNPDAANTAMLTSAYGTLDWRNAAATAKLLLKRFPWDKRIANNAAYILVLAGKPHAAERALTSARVSSKSSEDYVLLATMGLVNIAKGDAQAGLKMYRRAAELADRSPEGKQGRLRVTVYQGLVLFLIGKYDTFADMATRAGALPPIALPDDWADFPELNELAWICDRAGCKWPPMLP